MISFQVNKWFEILSQKMEKKWSNKFYEIYFSLFSNANVDNARVFIHGKNVLETHPIV